MFFFASDYFCFRDVYCPHVCTSVPHMEVSVSLCDLLRGRRVKRFSGDLQSFPVHLAEQGVTLGCARCFQPCEKKNKTLS
jgi:hypothetical protein